MMNYTAENQFFINLRVNSKREFDRYGHFKYYCPYGRTAFLLPKKRSDLTCLSVTTNDPLTLALMQSSLTVNLSEKVFYESGEKKEENFSRLDAGKYAGVISLHIPRGGLIHNFFPPIMSFDTTTFWLLSVQQTIDKNENWNASISMQFFAR